MTKSLNTIVNDEDELLKDPCKYMEFLESKIDNDLGFYFWKKYISSAFWAQVATPINLVITVLTALTTAQSTSDGFLSKGIYQDISISVLLITVVNTFFTPTIQMNKSLTSMNKWNSLGTNFEEIYYDIQKHGQYDEYIEKYKQLQKDINLLRESDGPESINFVTDFLHILSVYSCLRGYDKWLSNDRILMKKNLDKMYEQMGLSPCCDEGGCCNPSRSDIIVPPSEDENINPGEKEDTQSEETLLNTTVEEKMEEGKKD